MYIYKLGKMDRTPNISESDKFWEYQENIAQDLIIGITICIIDRMSQNRSNPLCCPVG